MHFALITTQSFKDFFPYIMETFSFNKMTTYLVQAPPYTVAYICSMCNRLELWKIQESCYHIVVPIVAAAVGAAVGAAILISTVNIPARYIGLILLVSGTYSGLNLRLPWKITLVPAPKEQEGCFDCNCKLCKSNQSLVQPLFLSSKPGAILSARRWTDHSWLGNHGGSLLWNPVACRKAQQRIGRSRRLFSLYR